MVERTDEPRQGGRPPRQGTRSPEAGPATQSRPPRAEDPPRTGRRRLFWVWVVLTSLVAVYVGLAAPFSSYFHDEMWLVAIVGPPLMIVLLSAGLAWLAWWVFGTRKTDRRR